MAEANRREAGEDASRAMRAMARRFGLLFTLTVLGAACLPTSAWASFGLGGFDATFVNSEGTPAMQAGSHPFAFTTSVEMNVSGEEPDGRLQELFFDEMPGLLANPTALPRCTTSDFNTLVEGVNDCPNSTAAGIFEGVTGEAESRTTSPVFNLVPPPGALIRLGFRLANSANVVVDFEVSQQPPYRLLATIGEVPETIELFAAKLRLWGVPASPEHDEHRGSCAVHGGSCPASIPQIGYLTLPTSCEGPQATYYEALSWEEDEATGNTFTHDNAEPPNPLGFGGCATLAFEPSFSARPTTEAAQTASGLDLSLGVSDEGITNPAGLAQSQIRDFALILPEGLTINPSASKSTEYCTEADLARESLESSPGEGCPEASKIGMIEVETPLAEKTTLHGLLFSAEPFEEEPNLYVVVKDPELGLIIKQLVEIERSPDTGQLTAYAEDMPQLPFSHLRIHLREGEGAALITPPRCAIYDGHDAAHEAIRAELLPWSGGAPLSATSTFRIASGPNGEPCPTGATESKSHPPAPQATPPAATPAGATPPNATIRKRGLELRKHMAVFSFQSNEPGSRFVCKLDRKKAERCNSPQRYRHLSLGRHVFRVWAIDAAGGKDPTPAIAHFRMTKSRLHRHTHRQHHRAANQRHKTRQ